MTREELFKGKSVKEVFTTIFENSIWKSNNKIDSISGSGSTLKYTENTRRELPIIFKQLGIKTLVDLGCGDLKWTNSIINQLDKYLGVDIVVDLININKKSFNSKKVSFEVFDIINYVPKGFDAVLIKDVLVHLKNEDILKILNNIRKGGVKYLIASHFFMNSLNKDVKFIGDWRPINFTKEPFNLPEPNAIINEASEDYFFDGVLYNDKSLGVWELKKF